MNKFELFSEKIRSQLNTYWYYSVCLAFTYLFYVLHLEWVAGLFLVLVVSFTLIVSDDVMTPLFPFLLMCAMVLRMYASFNYWIRFWPALIILISALIFHLIYYRHKFIIDKMLYPTVAVAVAITCGGLFSLTAKEYFAWTSIYYVFGLGFGMVILYLVFVNYIKWDDETKDKLTNTMVFLGVFLSLVLITFYIENAKLFFEDFAAFNDKLQMGNNLSANLFYTIPFAFYFMKTSKKPTLAFILGVVEYICLVATLSRGGILMGVIMLPIYCIYVYKTNAKTYKILMIVFLSLCVIAGIVLLCVFHDKIIKMLRIRPNEARVGLYKYAIECFIEKPIFGKGLGQYGAYYNPKPGAMYWFHSTPFQIIGSMGCVGIVAYVYQFFFRLNLYRKKHNKFTSCMFIAFIGFELLALVNPGDFSPIPYMLFMTLMFTVFEKESKKVDDKEKIVTEENVIDLAVEKAEISSNN